MRMRLRFAFMLLSLVLVAFSVQSGHALTGGGDTTILSAAKTSLARTGQKERAGGVDALVPVIGRMLDGTSGTTAGTTP